MRECWTWANANPGLNILCGGTADKTDTAFQILYDDMASDPLPGTQMESEPNNTIGSATLVAYAKSSSGSYFVEDLLGALDTGLDKDVFGITVPTDVKVSAGRLSLGFTLVPATVNGDGSLLESITGSLLDADTNAVIAKLDMGVYEMIVPVQDDNSGKKYAFKIEHNASGFTTGDWYVIQQTMGGSNPVEVGEAINNTLAGAQILIKDANSTASDAKFYIAGDIIDSGADVDYFAISVPSGMKYVTVNCSSKYMGSGVQGFAAQILTNSGADLSGGPQAENGASIQLKNLSIPFGTSKLTVKLSASGQDSTVTGAFHECGFDLTSVAAP